MIELLDTDIFASECEAILNPVNTVGVMGGGLARIFSNRYPEMDKAYKKACEDGSLAIGKVFVWKEPSENRFLICFPTKEHWRNNSKIEYIEDGLIALSKAIEEYKIKSVAFPALGAGLGGLSWDEVLPILMCYGEDHPEINIEIYHPK